MFQSHLHFHPSLRVHPSFRGLGSIVLLLLLIGACRQPAAPSPIPPAAATDSTGSAQKNFFPVADVLREEIRYVDSMPLAILKTTLHDNHTDSSFIRPDEFHRIAGEFLLPDLEEQAFAKKFTENSFMDRATGYLTFTYSALDKDLPLQRVDVVAIPNPSKTGATDIKSIFLQTSASSGDTLVVKRMLWTAKKNLLIITSLQPRDKPAVVRQLRLVWDSGSPE
jgi:hypothetical protein